MIKNKKLRSMLLINTAILGLIGVSGVTSHASQVNSQQTTYKNSQSNNKLNKHNNLKLGDNKQVNVVKLPQQKLHQAINNKLSQRAVNQPTNEDLVNNRTSVFSHHQSSTVGKKHLIHHKAPNIRAKAFVIMNRSNGEILAERRPNQKRSVASTGKLMTLYLAERKLARHPRAWHHKVTFNHALISMGRNPDFDGLHVKVGKKYTIRDVLKASLIGSDDNAAIRLGEWVGGSNRHFINMMNHQAKLWHLRSRFTSASGLDNSDLAPYGLWCKGGYYSGNKVTAKDLAIITYHLLKDYPSIMKYSLRQTARIHGQRVVNQNRIIKGNTYYVKSFRPDGLKTGYTPSSGLCFVGTSRRGHGLITVVLDAPNEFYDTDRLMRYAYKY